MWLKVSLLIVGTLLLASNQAAKVGRVYGGITASEGQFPYQISLRLNGTHICGGSILTDQVVVSAAYCVAKYKNNWMALPTEYFQVHAGSIDLLSGGVFVNVTRIDIHRVYSNRLNDLSVIKLATRLVFSEDIQPIEMNPEPILPGTDVIISGWGSLSDSGDAPILLQYNTLQAISKNKCFSELGLRYDFLLCLAHESGNGMCDSDVGGPVVYNGTLVGIAGHTKTDCGTDSPDTSAAISYHYDWIMSEVRWLTDS